MKKSNYFDRIVGILAVIVVVLAAICGLANPGINGAASSGSNNASSVAAIRRRGYLRVAVFGDLPPYGWVNDQGKRVGYDLRLARRIAHDMHVGIKFIQVNANNRVDTLNSNKADLVLANFTETPERKHVVEWARPYMKVAVGVISPKAAAITKASQLQGKSLIVTKGTTAENYFTKQGNVNLLRFDSKTQQFNALKNKRAAALADDNSYLYAWVKRNPQYQVGIKTIGPKQYIAPAVKKGNKSLLTWLNREIKSLNRESFFIKDYNYELKPYFGKDIKPSDIVLKQGK